MTPYNKSIERLQAILSELRTKCPWDKVQTIHTLRKNTIEELYELIDAIEQNDWQNIQEELGDLLLHILFYSLIAKEEQQFEFGDVINTISNKLIRRHPHIYDNIIAKDEETVKLNWEKIKKQEGKKSVLSGVPTGLPSIIKAFRLQEKAKQIGFEWETKEDVLEKIQEEMNELQEAINDNKQAQIEEEFGDVMFSLINYARFLKIDPDQALNHTNNKFKHRFEYMETYCHNNNIAIENLTLAALNDLWEQAKRNKL